MSAEPSPHLEVVRAAARFLQDPDPTAALDGVSRHAAGLFGASDAWIVRAPNARSTSLPGAFGARVASAEVGLPARLLGGAGIRSQPFYEDRHVVAPFTDGGGLIAGTVADPPSGDVLVALAAMACMCELRLRFAADLEAAARLRAELETAHERLLQQNVLLGQLLVIDDLTGLRNRRFFDRTCRYELERTRRYRSALSVMLIDADHFKRVNDAYGHAAGDRTLQAIARSLEGAVRTTDLVSRYGGEEFAVLLPETDAAGAAFVGERIRHAVAAIAGLPSAVTVSVGVLTVPAGACVVAEALLERADAALYRAKSGGRNRVVSCVVES